MRSWTVVALLGLAAVGAYGSSGLLDVLGLKPDMMIAMSGIDLPSIDKTGEDDPPPCGISPSKAVIDATTMCVNEAAGGGGKGKGKGKRRGRRGRRDENAVQKCVFEKLSLVDEESTPIQAEIVKLIDTYTGDAEGKQVMKRMAEKCMGAINLAPAKKKANVLMTCVKMSMQIACKVHDLKKENPSLALMVAQKSAEKCMESIELPPKMVWSRVRCAAEELKKFADARLATLAPARKRRSPKRGKKDKAKKEKKENEENMEEDDSKKKGSKKDPAERRRRGKARREEMRKQELQEDKKKLEKVVGPLEQVIEAAGDALLETGRCTYAAAGVLDADNNVDSDKMKMLLSEATGTPQVKATLLAAAKMCLAKDPASAAFIECLNNELTVTCPAAMSIDKRQKKANRRGGRGRNRPAATAGRPTNVAKPKMPAALKRTP